MRTARVAIFITAIVFIILAFWLVWLGFNDPLKGIKAVCIVEGIGFIARALALVSE